jgi:hypothetical protein
MEAEEERLGGRVVRRPCRVASSVVTMATLEFGLGAVMGRGVAKHRSLRVVGHVVVQRGRRRSVGRVRVSEEGEGGAGC